MLFSPPANTRVSDAPITNRNKVYEPDHVVVLDPNLVGADVFAGLRPGGAALINSPRPLGELAAARTVVWNGPPGVFEWKSCQRGSKAVAEAIAAGWRVALSARTGRDLVAEATRLEAAEALLATGRGIVRLDREGQPALPLEEPVPYPPTTTWVEGGEQR